MDPHFRPSTRTASTTARTATFARQVASRSSRMCRSRPKAFRCTASSRTTGATTSILGGSIATAGTQANGVLAENGGTVTIGVSNSGATSVVTSGTSAPGVVAYVGGAVQITGATIATNGDGSSGLSLNGAGSSITATGISVTTRGGVDTATGNRADGAYNGALPAWRCDLWRLPVVGQFDGCDQRRHRRRRRDRHRRNDDDQRRFGYNEWGPARTQSPSTAAAR